MPPDTVPDTASDHAIALAQQLGQHALPAFGVGLTVCLGMVATLWWLAVRHWVPQAQRRLQPTAFLALHIVLGGLGVLTAAWGFAEIAGHIGTPDQMGPVGRFDDALVATLRETLSRPTLEAFAWVTRFGDTPTLTVLGITVALWLVWRQRYALALGWVLAVAGNSLLNVGLKSIFARVRPLHEHGVTVAEGFSFPSGHSSGSLVAYGMLAYVVVRCLPDTAHRGLVLLAMLLAAGIAFATGFSRIFLQVHYASDVLAGFTSGLAWLVVCISAVEALRQRPRNRLGRE